MRAKFLTPLIVALTLAPAGVVFAAEEAAPAPVAEAPPSNEVRFSATLTGANEVDGQGVASKGDSDGTGSFSAKLDTKADTLCYTLTWSGIDDPTMAHIHAGAAGRNGAVAIGLPDIDPGEHCIEVDSERYRPLVKKPADFYVNIHNGDFPAGAIRGQVVKE